MFILLSFELRHHPRQRRHLICSQYGYLESTIFTPISFYYYNIATVVQWLFGRTEGWVFFAQMACNGIQNGEFVLDVGIW